MYSVIQCNCSACNVPSGCRVTEKGYRALIGSHGRELRVVFGHM
jgi:hypothetical protein